MPTTEKQGDAKWKATDYAMTTSRTASPAVKWPSTWGSLGRTRVLISSASGGGI